MDLRPVLTMRMKFLAQGNTGAFDDVQTHK